MGLTRLAISRPVLTVMAFAALAVLGLQSLSLMPVELFPRIDFPFITIITVYPGAGPREIETLISKQLAEDVIKDRLAKVTGVASVSVVGGQQREVEVEVDKARLQAYGLSIGQVAQALTLENLNLPSGGIREGRQEYAVRTVGEFERLEDLLEVRLPTASGAPVLLRDIAHISSGFADRTQLSRLNQRDSVGIVIQKQADANTVRVVSGVKHELDRLRPDLPGDLVTKVAYDQSTFL